MPLHGKAGYGQECFYGRCADAPAKPKFFDRAELGYYINRAEALIVGISGVIPNFGHILRDSGDLTPCDP